MCKETFRDIYASAETYNEAKDLFEQWLLSVPTMPAFSGIRTTMTRREEHVLNYWKHRYTNAFTESMNNRIKAIQKAGRGYKFHNLRRRCLLELNTSKPEKFDPNTAVYVAEDGTIAPDKRKEKIKKVYAPDAKPVIKNASVSSRPAGTLGMMVPIRKMDSVVYQPHQGELKEYLWEYLKIQADHLDDSFSERMWCYYNKLRELNI